MIEYVGHIGLRSLTDGHLGRHLEYFKTLNDARVASLGLINYNASTTRINKEKNFKIKLQVILVFYQTILHFSINLWDFFFFFLGGGEVFFAYKIPDSYLNDGYACCFMVAIRHSNFNAEI